MVCFERQHGVVAYRLLENDFSLIFIAASRSQSCEENTEGVKGFINTDRDYPFELD